MSHYKGSRAGSVESHYSDRGRALKERARERAPSYNPDPGRERPARPLAKYKPDPRSNRPRPMTPKDYEGPGHWLDRSGKPIPPPRAPNAPGPVKVPEPVKKVFEKYGRNPELLRRKLSPLLRRFPWMRLYDFLDEWDKNNGGGYGPAGFPNPARGWRKTAQCFAEPLSGANRWWSISETEGAPDKQTSYCLSGQASEAPTNFPVGAIPNSNYFNGLMYVRSYWVEGISSWREARVANFERPWDSWVEMTNGPITVPGWTMGPSPNIMRDMPGEKPEERPRNEPAYEPDAPSQWQWQTQPAGTRRIPVAPVTRSPYREPDKEQKIVPRSRRLAVALYKALDWASEAAEVVDAIFQALPEEIQKRYRQPKRPGDNFGQYGLEGADWKAEAIYENWDKIDWEAAVENIFKNHLQDKVIGGYQKWLPKNAGNAHADGEKQFAKWLDKWLTVGVTGF